MDYLAEAEALSGDLAALREAFHRAPELGNQEFRTAERIEGCLRDLGIPSRRVAGTGVVGTLTGARPGPCAALRADMDALPLQEATGASFASGTPGVMHACGHDVHMTAALGAARILASHREDLAGTALFLFQPNEERDGGAERMIQEGALEGLGAGPVFGAHVDPALPLGQVGVRFGKFYAASDLFSVVVTGKSAHGAEREKGIDALGTAARMVLALLDLPGEFPDERSVLHVGTLHAGTAGNIVADRAEFVGTLRTLGPEARRGLKEHFAGVLRDAAAASGAGVNFELKTGYPGVVNDDAMTRLVQAAASDLLGPERVTVIPGPTMTTEDFGCFLERQPGSFYHIGAGCPLPLHSAGFLPDARAAVVGAALHAAVLSRALAL